MIGGQCDVTSSSPVLSVFLSSKSFARSSSVPVQGLPISATSPNGSAHTIISSTSPSSSCSTSSAPTSVLLVKSASTSALTKTMVSQSPSNVAESANIAMKKDCEAIRLPENLESIPRAEQFPTQRHRWNTNEEIAALLISFDKHNDWLSKEVKIRPKSGSMLLYSRKKVRYRRDGYCWKKRKDGKTTREDHMKLKVQGIECIYGCYVHSAILPTFHRRCYWLLQNPDIVLVHYLNVPYPDDNKLIMASSISLWADKKEWTKEELVSQLKPMFFSEEEPDMSNELEISTAETVEAIVVQLMEKQRAARAASNKNSTECGCGSAMGTEHAKHCPLHPSVRRLTIAKIPQQQHHNNHHGHHPVQQPQPHHNQHHPHNHSHSQHETTTTSLMSSRQGLVSAPDPDVNQVSSTSAAPNPRFPSLGTLEGSHRSQPPTSSPSNNKLGCNNINNNKNIISSNSSANDNDNSNKNCNNGEEMPDDNDSNNNSLTSTATPLILNLSNIQGGGGLLILNSGAHTHAGAATSHAQHPLATPFTLTSYFGQPHAVTSTASGGRQVLHSLQHGMQLHHHQGTPHYTQGHAQHHAQHHTSQLLMKREAKEEAVESVRLDVTNGNLTMDSGTFANLVSSLEGNTTPTPTASAHTATAHTAPAHTKTHRDSHRDSFLAVKSEHQLTDMSVIKQELFSDPLALSPEDIQKTLSANLDPTPNSCSKSPHNNQHGNDENPMDFIDSNIASAEDDVLANLDAFDMLSDFPDLDHYDTSTPPDNLNSNSSNSSCTNVSGKSVTNQSMQTVRIDYRDTSSNITDYSPEWAYPEGGIKVLVTGPWYSNTSPYTVLFDGVPTPTTLVQAGVLRCYCPAHEAGLVTLQVACDGFVISNSVIFEYKKPPIDISRIKEEESVQEQDEHLLKFTLLQRLESIETRVQPQSERNPQDSPTSFENDVMMHKSTKFQDRVIYHCQKTSQRQWLPGANSLVGGIQSPKESCFLKGQTILHLAARLGYTRLIVCLLRWREENPSFALECEVDALRKDKRGRTPLAWACAQGQRDAALILYRWNPQALSCMDNQGLTPIKTAIKEGHKSLSEELKRLEEETEKSKALLSSSLLSNSSSSSHVSSPLVASTPSSSLLSLNVSSGVETSASTNISTDVFLRPSPRRCDLRKQRHLSVDFPIGGDSDGSARASGAAGSSTGSPALSWSEGGRRGRIVKRPSVDSGINLVSVDSFKRASLDSGLDILQKHSRNYNLRTPFEALIHGDKTTEDVLLSPMHFELLGDAVTALPREPDPEDEPRTSGHGGDSSAVEMTSADDSRVFTLAEQIIAAIPERIKGDEEDVTELLNPCLSDPPSSDLNTDLNMEVIMDEPPDANSEFNFEFSDIMSYRYMEVGTPSSSSLSPASSTHLPSPSPHRPSPSPASFPLDSPSPPPTTADFSEFFHASNRDFSKDFSNLTLSDQEQRELYEAAKIIQKAYRIYKGRKRQQAEKDKERQAAVLIQNYYRRYKQYAYFRQMSRAATLIQNQFRSYCESKRFKKSQEGAKFNLRASREGTPVPNLKRSYSQRRQHQAARKIQQFMRQTKQKLQRERAQAAERETLQGSGLPLVAGGRAHSPGRGPPSLPPRGAPGALSSERSRRVTDPLLSTTALPRHRTEAGEETSFGSF